MERSATESGVQSVVALVWDVLQRRRTGTLEHEHDGETVRMEFVEGELHLLADQPLAKMLAPVTIV